MQFRHTACMQQWQRQIQKDENNNNNNNRKRRGLKFAPIFLIFVRMNTYVRTKQKQRCICTPQLRKYFLLRVLLPFRGKNHSDNKNRREWKEERRLFLFIPWPQIKKGTAEAFLHMKKKRSWLKNREASERKEGKQKIA